VKPKSLSSIQPPTALARRFVRYVVGFSVGVGVGLAPFLGYFNIPGFRALLNLLPLQLRDGLVSFSAFFMGIVVIALQFYSTERLTSSNRRKLFALALATMLVGFFALVVLYGDYVELVPRGKSYVGVMISSSRTKACTCPESISDIDCISMLALDEGAVQTCWGSRPLKRVALRLRLAYLSVTCGFGILVAILLLRPSSRKRKKPATDLPKSTPKSREVRQAEPRRTKARATQKAKSTPDSDTEVN